MFPGKQFSGTSEARSNLVEDKQQTIFTAQPGRLTQILRMIKTHTAGSLNYRLQYQSGKRLMMLFDCFLQWKNILLVPFGIETALRRRHKITYRKRRTKQTMHARHRIAYRHRIPCISMIAGTDCHKIVLFRLSRSKLILYRHLQCDLHSHRTTVGIKNLLHGRRNNLQKQFSQCDGRLMRKSSKHHMRHVFQLLFNRPIQYRMIISMYGTPPRRHTVYQFRTVFQRNDTPFCPFHLIRRQRVNGRRIGMPQMLPVEVINTLFISHNPPPLFVFYLLPLSNPASSANLPR